MSKFHWNGKAYLTWNQIETYVKILSNNIKKTGFEFDKIASVSRGGLVPSRLIADHFNIKKILVDPKRIPKKTIFVDDIYDSGVTFKKMYSRASDPNNFLYATLIARRGMDFPNELIYAKQTRGKEYVIFPWDKLESVQFIK